MIWDCILYPNWYADWIMQITRGWKNYRKCTDHQSQQVLRLSVRSPTFLSLFRYFYLSMVYSCSYPSLYLAVYFLLSLSLRIIFSNKKRRPNPEGVLDLLSYIIFRLRDYWDLGGRTTGTLDGGTGRNGSYYPRLGVVLLTATAISFRLSILF
jgi:hypothetical protein